MRFYVDYENVGFDGSCGADHFVTAALDRKKPVPFRHSPKDA